MAQMMRSMNMRSVRPVPSSRKASVVVRVGLLDFFQPKVATAPNPRAAELVEELVEVASSTSAGSKATPEKRQQIEELVGELQKFSVKNPSKSKLLFGEYEVLYASAPTAPGGPLAGPAGAITLSGKLPVEVLGEDGSYSSSVEFKSLGFLGGSFKQQGSIRALGTDSYQLELSESSYQSGLGGPSTKQLSDSFKVQLLYLGEELRVVEVGSEAEESFLMVLKRVQEEEEEEEEEQTPVARKGFTGITLPLPKSQEVSFATMTERQVMRQMAKEEEAQRTGSRAVKAGSAVLKAGPVAVAAGTRSLRPAAAAAAAAAKPDPKAQAAAAKEAEQKNRAAAAAEAKAQAAAAKEAEQKKRAAAVAQAAKEREAEEKEKAAAAAKERALAEKKAAADRQAAIRDLLASLGDDVKARQTDVKGAVQELKDVERSGGAVLKKVAAARAKIEDAAEDTEEAQEALEAAGAARVDADGKVKEAQAVLAQAQSKLKEAQAAVKPKF